MNNVCQNCKKARATVHLTEIDPEDNEPHEMHLCESCARESGGPQKLGAQAVAFTTSVIIQDKGPISLGASRKLICPHCGMTYQEFRTKGRFGCVHCYETFEEGLVGLLEKVHGASRYEGPRPPSQAGAPRSSAAFEQELVDLRRRLSRVIKNEDYEEAARLRDRIQQVEDQLAKPPETADE